MLEKTLPPELRRAVERSPRRDEIRELRFRLGSAVRAVYPREETDVTVNGKPVPVTDALLKELLDRATGFSPYALRLEESGLYLPLEGGCRMGLCGEAMVRDGKLAGLRRVRSAVIRIARECRGVAAEAADRITAKGNAESVLIVSPPGRGKTTFLRDLIRAVSRKGFRVSVADERRELAGDEGSCIDLGPCTDVLSGCPKAQAMRLLLRVMNPQVLAVDELSGEEEFRPTEEIAGCGVAVFATAHADDLRVLSVRPGARQMLSSGAFRWGVVLHAPGLYEMERLDGYVENRGGVYGGSCLGHGRLGGTSEHARQDPDPAAAPTGARTDAGGNGAGNAHSGGAV